METDSRVANQDAPTCFSKVVRSTAPESMEKENQPLLSGSGSSWIYIYARLRSTSTCLRLSITVNLSKQLFIHHVDSSLEPPARDSMPDEHVLKLPAFSSQYVRHLELCADLIGF
jgi:hypothetical protein